jgi:hypothetical protein
MPVLDSNLPVVLVSGDPRRSLVLQQLMTWLDNDIELQAPILAQYEIANATPLTLGLAVSLNSELWTLDGPPYTNAMGYGFNVRLIQ